MLKQKRPINIRALKSEKQNNAGDYLGLFKNISLIVTLPMVSSVFKGYFDTKLDAEDESRCPSFSWAYTCNK